MVLVFAALIATTTALDVRRERAMFTEEMETRGLILSAALSEVLGNYLYVSDVDRIRDITKVVASDPKVHFVRVYRPDGRIVADTGQGAGYPTGAATSESGRRALEGRETVFQMNGGILEVSAPIVAGKQVLGGVVLGFSQASVESEIGAIALERIWQSLGLILAAALVALLITYYVARPIRRLVAATRNVARGQFDFSPQDSWVREISELTESFEKMTHALGTARSELETRVEQRTAELKESERSLVEARNRLRTVVENLPSPHSQWTVMACSLSRRVRAWRPLEERRARWWANLSLTFTVMYRR